MGSNLLTQEEIDALLRGEGDPEGEFSGKTEAELTSLEQDTLSELGNISLGSAATALSTLVNRKVDISVPAVSMTTLAEVKEGYPVPCLVFQVQYNTGLKGDNLLIVRESDAKMIAAMMMGSDLNDLPDELDELQISAVTEAMNQMMGSAATAMSDMFGRSIEISPPRMQAYLGEGIEFEGSEVEPLVKVAFNLQIEDALDSEFVQLIKLEFAREMVSDLIGEDASAQEKAADKAEPIEPKTPSAVPPAEPEAPAGRAPAGSTQAREPELSAGAMGNSLGNLNIELIKNIPVRVRAILGRTKLPIEKVLSLSSGSLVELDSLEGEPIEILANDTLIARGEVVVVGETFGVRITEVATPAERINSVT